MKILDRLRVEDCFDGSSIYVYQLSEPWTEKNVRRLSGLGHFQYFSDFPRPLFRLRTNSGLFVNGVCGACDCRVILPRRHRDQTRQQLEEVLMSE